MNGSCLCGDVKFSIAGAVGPFELCHCSRCRKVSGSAYVAALVTESEGFEITSGRELIKSFEAVILTAPPPYTIYFCSVCGSHLPDPDPRGQYLDIPAGLFDDDVSISPDKHIYTDRKANWDRLNVSLPEFTESEFRRKRSTDDE